jgi:flagellar motility protein MotE (MotC chaperone)
VAAQIRLYLDEDSSSIVLARMLRQAGYDVLSALEAGNLEWSDEEQLEFAIAKGRVLYTANQADFARIHHVFADEGRRHFGIIIRSWQRMPPALQAAALLELIRTQNADEMMNALEFLRPPQLRG